MTRRAIPPCLLVWTLAVMAATPLPRAQGQDYGDPDYELTPFGYRDHTGFFSHIDLGLGWTSAKAHYAGTDVENRGLGIASHLAIGGSVLPRLAVHFSAFGFDSVGADLLIDGRRQVGVDGGITSTALGAGVTWYLPVNLVLSGSVGVAFASAVNDIGVGSSLKPGLAARLAVGYEWWVGAYWGLGLAAQVQYLRAKDNDVAGDPTWQTLVLGPAFSATSN